MVEIHPAPWQPVWTNSVHGWRIGISCLWSNHVVPPSKLQGNTSINARVWHLPVAQHEVCCKNWKTKRQRSCLHRSLCLVLSCRGIKTGRQRCILKIVSSHVGTDTATIPVKIDYNFVGNMILLQFCLKIVCKFMKDKTPHIYSLHPLHKYRSFLLTSFEIQAVFLALNYLLLSKELRKNFTGHLKSFAHTSSDTWNRIIAYLPNKLGDMYER